MPVPSADPSVGQLNQLRQSFGRCCLAEEFVDSFYDFFFASSPQIPVLFANTEMNRQKRMLKNSLTLLVMSGSGSEFADGVVTDLAERHSSRSLDIKPHLYTHWLDSLMRAIQHHDPDYSLELDKLWRDFLSKSIAFMKSKY